MRLTLRSYYETSGTVKLLLPPQQSWGISYVCLGDNRRTDALYGELIVPLDWPVVIDSANATLAVRQEKYSDFGSFTSPKLSLVVSPSSGFYLRGSWAKSFRAPHFSQVISRRNDYFVDTFVNDTELTTESDSPPLLVYLFGPNPELEPERATTWTLGFDWFSQSVSGLNLSTTYFNIHYDNRIIDVSYDIDYLDDEEIPGVVVSATSPYFQQTLAEIINLQPSLFDEIGRDPSETELILDYRLRNEYKTVVDGIDFSLDYDFDTVLGAWSYLFQGTYLFGYKSQLNRSVQAKEFVDIKYYPVDFRSKMRLSWSKGTLGASLTTNYVDSYAGYTGKPFESEKFDIDSWTTLDFNLRYKFDSPQGSLTKGLVVNFNVDNLFDRPPPEVLDITNQRVIDHSNSTILGRNFWLTMAINW